MAMGGAGAGERSPGGRGGGLILFIFAPLARFAGVLVVVLLPLVLGYIGLHQYLSQPAAAAAYGHGWADTAFYDLQLPVLAAAPVEGAGPYPVPLGIARLLAPAVAGLATLGTLRLLLAEQRRRWSAATARRHAVVVGDGPVAIELARRLRAEMRKVVLVGSSDTTLTWARTNRLLGVRGEPADPSALRAAGIARARELYACTDLGTANAAIAVQARDEVPVGRKRPLAAYALVHDVELGVAFQARSIGAAGDPRLRLDFFNVADIAARKLLDEYPLAVTDGPRASVVIVGGSGQLGRAILREIARRHQPGSPRVEVVLRHAAADAVAAVTAAFPEISASCLVTTAAGAELPAAAQYTVFVCVDDDDDALREGLAMAPGGGRPRGPPRAAMSLSACENRRPWAGSSARAARWRTTSRKSSGCSASSRRLACRPAYGPISPSGSLAPSTAPMSPRRQKRASRRGPIRRWPPGNSFRRTCASPTSPRPPISARSWR
jgi:hypothetical protein